MLLLPFKRFCREHEAWAWLAAITVPLAVIAVGCVVWPGLFWDGFVWRHIWAPLVADAEDRTVDGIGEGYTVVSTVTYAAFLSLAVFGIWRAFQRPGIVLDGRFLLALVPWVVVGAVARALEDAHLFAPEGPVVYLFISPVIYIFEGVLVFTYVMLAWRAERLGTQHGWRVGLLSAVGLLVALNLAPALVLALGPGQLAVHAGWGAMALATAAGAAALWWRARATGGVAMVEQLLVAGCVLLVSAAAFVAVWARDPWAESTRATHPWEVAVILGIAAACAAATWAGYALLSRRHPRTRAFVSPVALLLFLSHYIDGAATYRGLDAWGYGEKHVLPSLLIDATGTAAVMLLLKLVVVSAVVYLLDVAYREDMARTPTLTWLVRLAVLVLGLAPGVRDMLRIAMGV